MTEEEVKVLVAKDELSQHPEIDVDSMILVQEKSIYAYLRRNEKTIHRHILGVSEVVIDHQNEIVDLLRQNLEVSVSCQEKLRDMTAAIKKMQKAVNHKVKGK